MNFAIQVYASYVYTLLFIFYVFCSFVCICVFVYSFSTVNGE